MKTSAGLSLLLSAATASAQEIEYGELSLEELLNVKVVSASFREQSIHEAPSAVSTLDEEEVMTAPTRLMEALRKVPGIWIIQSNANHFTVGLRGANGLINNRVLVLVNGRRLPSFTGDTVWSLLPYHVGEIERVEVIRGPGATLYGADALSGVINITTRDPLENPGGEGTVSVGLAAQGGPAMFETHEARRHNVTHGYVGHGWKSESGKLGVRGSIGFEHGGEFGDHATQYFREMQGQYGWHASLASTWEPDDKTRLSANATYSSQEQIESVTLRMTKITFQYDELAATASFERRGLFDDLLTVRAVADVSRFVQRPGQINALHLGGNTGRLGQGHGLILGDLKLFGGRNTLTVGAEATYRLTNFPILFRGTRPQTTFTSLMAQDEFKILDSLILNAGIRLEQVSSEYQAPRPVIHRVASPRISAIWRPAKQHSLRVTAASGYRTPSLFENFGNYTLDPESTETPLLLQGPNPSLRPELVRSVELAYLGAPTSWLQVDAVGYLQSMAGPIMERQLVWPTRYENTADHDSFGLELGLKFNRGRKHHGYLSYGFRHQLSSGPIRYPPHLVALGGEFELPGKIKLTTDINVIGGFPFEGYYLGGVPLQAPTSFLFPTPTFPIINARISRAFSESVELFGYAGNLFSLTNLYPWQLIGNTDAIGSTFLVGIRAKGL
jgi:outer membrane receptor protein involved in Fe transport